MNDDRKEIDKARNEFSKGMKEIGNDSNNNHNAELQQCAPNTNYKGAFSPRGRIFLQNCIENPSVMSDIILNARYLYFH